MKPTLLIGIAAALFSVACNKEETLSGDTSSTTPPEAKKEAEPQETPRTLVGGEMKDGEEVAVMDTTAGKIVIRFFTKEAPKTVENFTKLAKKGFYEGVKFHRTIPGFMIQGGDPNSKSGDPMSWGSGGPGYTIPDELNDIKHEPGILSMAHAGPNTGGSQFFIMVGNASHLDRVHTVFGEVVTGMSTVQKIVNTPTTDSNGTVVPSAAVAIKSVKIEKWPLKE